MDNLILELKDNVKWFNDILHMLNNITDDEFQDCPCIIFFETFNRDKTGRLIFEPTFKTMSFEHLSDLKQFRLTYTNKSYRIHGIVFLIENTYHSIRNLFVNIPTLTKFKEYGVKYGLYLDSKHYLFRKLVEPYNLFSSSWFIDSDEDSDY